MSAGKEIRNKIKSVQNTRKITLAMQMVATSKMCRTQKKMLSARPYAEHIRRVMANLAYIGSYVKSASSLLRKPSEIKKVGIILITADKGLCGGLNSNAIKLFYEKVNSFQKSEIVVAVCALGHKGLNATKKVGLNIISSAVGMGDVPQMEKILGPISGIIKKFRIGELDAVYVLYSHYVNTMRQEPTFEQLLPLKDAVLTQEQKSSRDYIYEPNPKDVLDGLIQRYIESVVFQCVADNMASEQASRMVAMKAATDNAGNAIDELKLVYNKSRQATITKELAEIVAGSVAV